MGHLTSGTNYLAQRGLRPQPNSFNRDPTGSTGQTGGPSPPRRVAVKRAEDAGTARTFLRMETNLAYLAAPAVVTP